MKNGGKPDWMQGIRGVDTREQWLDSAREYNWQILCDTPSLMARINGRDLQVWVRDE